MSRSRSILASFGLVAVFAASSVSAATCNSASLADYVTMAGGCSVGTLTFSNFVVEAFPGPTATQIAPGTLTVMSLPDGFSLSSSSPLVASTNELLGLRLLFDVSAPSLIGATVALGDQASATGDGVVTALVDAGAAGNAIAIVIDGFSDSIEKFSTSASPSYSAFLELGVDGGTAGQASPGSTLVSITFDQTATPVPEPSVAALSLIGLGLLFVRLRRTARA